MDTSLVIGAPLGLGVLVALGGVLIISCKLPAWEVIRNREVDWFTAVSP
jgi:hypothetical protein